MDTFKKCTVNRSRSLVLIELQLEGERTKQNKILERIIGGEGMSAARHLRCKFEVGGRVRIARG